MPKKVPSFCHKIAAFPTGINWKLSTFPSPNSTGCSDELIGASSLEEQARVSGKGLLRSWKWFLEHTNTFWIISAASVQTPGRVWSNVTDLEMFKVEWKQQLDLWGRWVREVCCLITAWAAHWPRSIRMEILFSNSMLICSEKWKDTTLSVQEGHRLHHSIFKYSISYFFSNSLTTRVYLFNDEELLTLAPLWKCM